MPGLSGTPNTVIFASSRLNAMPEMIGCSMLLSLLAGSSNVISVPSPSSSKLESTRSFTLYLPANSTSEFAILLNLGSQAQAFLQK